MQVLLVYITLDTMFPFVLHTVVTNAYTHLPNTKLKLFKNDESEIHLFIIRIELFFYISICGFAG